MKYLIVSFLLYVISESAIAQDFYKGYLNQLNTNVASCKIPYQNEQSVDMLKQLFSKVEHEKNIAMLSADSIYMISYCDYNIPISEVAMLVWNKKHSCHYNYRYQKQKGVMVSHVLTFQADADSRIKNLQPQLKKWIENVDTLDFNNYKKNQSIINKRRDSVPMNNRMINPLSLSTGGIMSFTVAVKTTTGWTFVSSNTYSANL